jgi:hypothetical protein
MLRIDVKRRDVGKVCPPYYAPNCDRPAHFEFQGKLFDAHGREIIPGVAMVEDEAPAVADAGGKDSAAPSGALSAAELVRIADRLSWPDLKAKAEAILGSNTPKSKQQVLAKIKALAEGRSLKALPPVSREGVAITEPPGAGAIPKPVKRGGPKAWPAQPAADQAAAQGAADAAPAAVAAAAPPAAAASAKPGEIDLAAWGRGETNYLSGQLTKAARAQFNVQLTERRDILDALIERGMVTLEGARTDL